MSGILNLERHHVASNYNKGFNKFSMTKLKGPCSNGFFRSSCLMSKLPVKQRVYLKKPRDLELQTPKFGSKKSEFGCEPYGCEDFKDYLRNNVCHLLIVGLLLVMILSSIILRCLHDKWNIKYAHVLPFLIFLPIIVIIVTCWIEEFDCCFRARKDMHCKCCFSKDMNYDNSFLKPCDVQLACSVWTGLFWIFFFLLMLDVAGIPEIATTAADLIFGFAGTFSLIIISVIYFSARAWCDYSSKTAAKAKETTTYEPVGDQS